MDYNHMMMEACAGLADTSRFLQEFLNAMPEDYENMGPGKEVMNYCLSEVQTQAAHLELLQNKHNNLFWQAQARVGNQDLLHKYHEHCVTVVPIADMFKIYQRRSTVVQVTNGVDVPDIEIFPVKDPWSKAYFRDPVRNKKCGHIYDHESFMLELETNDVVVCPYEGCTNDSILTMADIVDDSEMRQNVMDKIDADMSG